MVQEKINDNLEERQPDEFWKLLDDLESDEDVRKLNDVLLDLSTRVLDNNGRFPDWERKPDWTSFPRCLEWKEKWYFHSVHCGDISIYCREDWFLAIDSWKKCTVIKWNPQTGINSGSDYEMTIYKAKEGRIPQESGDYETRESVMSPEKLLKLITYCNTRLSNEEKRRQDQQDQSKIDELTKNL